jgi:hypothetical protein
MDDQPVPLDQDMKFSILSSIDLMTQDALRVLGMAYKVTPELPDVGDGAALESDLVFAGMVGMSFFGPSPARAKASGQASTRCDHRRLSQHPAAVARSIGLRVWARGLDRR